MKKFKKTGSFGQKDRWQIGCDQIEFVYQALGGYEASVDEEDIEIVILALEKLGYLEFEE